MRKQLMEGAHQSAANGYWDIHNHILPGVDDGSGSAAESLEMLEAEYSQGVRNIVFTPHYREGMFTVAADVRERVFRDFCEMAGERFPDMRCFLGCELHVTESMLAHLVEYLADYRCRMADTNAVLVEFSSRATMAAIRRIIAEVISQSCTPIIAHAERCDELRAEPEEAARLRQEGALIQINADTILEGIFSPRKKFAKKLLEIDAVDFIASDAHDNEIRPVRLEVAMQAISKKFGEARSERLFRGNAEEIFGVR